MAHFYTPPGVTHSQAARQLAAIRFCVTKRPPWANPERSKKVGLKLLLPPFMTWELASEEVPNQTKYLRSASDPKDGHGADPVHRA